MVLRLPGPFDYFQEKYAGVNGDVIRAHVSDPTTHADAITALADELDGDDKRVAQQVEGDIETGARTNAQHASRHARTLAANGRFAVGLLTRFADDVDTFDSAVNHLNLQVDLAVLPPLMKKRTTELRPAYLRAENALDTAADDVARLFRGGATPENVRTLIREGAMPLSSAALYPGLTLTADDKAAYYRALEQQKTMGELEDVALKNPALAWLTAKVAGFQHVPGGDFYTTNEHSIQSYLGFHDAYDDAGKHLGMDLDDNTIEFAGKDGQQYRLELWKGSYGSGSGFGGEVGFYTRGSHVQDPVSWAKGVLSGHPTAPSPVDMTRSLLEGRDPGYYSTAQGDDQIQVTQTISDKNTGQQYFTNDGAGADGGESGDKRHFWNLAIRTEPGHTKQDLVQTGSITVQDPDTRQAMYEAMKSRENDSDPDRRLASVTIDDDVIHYTWDK